MLDRRPLAMPRHCRLLSTSSRNRSCTRVSSVSSGWNDATRKRPSRSSTGSPSSSASTSTPGPTSRTRGARMKTPRSGSLLALELEVGLEARHLPAVGVAVDLDVDEAEVVAVEQDHPRAGAEHRRREPADRVLEPVEAHQPHDRRRLAARDDEAVESLELLGLPHLDDLRAEPAQHRRVLAEVPLQREDADRHDAIVGTAADSEAARARPVGEPPWQRRARRARRERARPHRAQLDERSADCLSRLRTCGAASRDAVLERRPASHRRESPSAARPSAPSTRVLDRPTASAGRSQLEHRRRHERPSDRKAVPRTRGCQAAGLPGPPRRRAANGLRRRRRRPRPSPVDPDEPARPGCEVRPLAPGPPPAGLRQADQRVQRPRRPEGRAGAIRRTGPAGAQRRGDVTTQPSRSCSTKVACRPGRGAPLPASRDLANAPMKTTYKGRPAASARSASEVTMQASSPRRQSHRPGRAARRDRGDRDGTGARVRAGRGLDARGDPAAQASWTCRSGSRLPSRPPLPGLGTTARRRDRDDDARRGTAPVPLACYQPRTSRALGREQRAAEMPTIGSPSPPETSREDLRRRGSASSPRRSPSRARPGRPT